MVLKVTKSLLVVILVIENRQCTASRKLLWGHSDLTVTFYSILVVLEQNSISRTGPFYLTDGSSRRGWIQCVYVVFCAPVCLLHHVCSVKIDPCFHQDVVAYVPDASKAVGVASQLLSQEQKPTLATSLADEYILVPGMC